MSVVGLFSKKLRFAPAPFAVQRPRSKFTLNAVTAPVCPTGRTYVYRLPTPLVQPLVGNVSSYEPMPNETTFVRRLGLLRMLTVPVSWKVFVVNLLLPRK